MNKEVCSPSCRGEDLTKCINLCYRFGLGGLHRKRLPAVLVLNPRISLDSVQKDL